MQLPGIRRSVSDTFDRTFETKPRLVYGKIFKIVQAAGDFSGISPTSSDIFTETIHTTVANVALCFNLHRVLHRILTWTGV